jgi:broad specificity phosphatase PhoE
MSLFIYFLRHGETTASQTGGYCGTLNIMLCSLLVIDVGRFRDRISMSVASISIVEMAMQGPLLHMMGMGDRSHLRGFLHNQAGT